MMQASKDSTGVDPMTVGKLLSMCASRDRCLDGLRYAWPEHRVWATPIVVPNELRKSPAKVPLIDRDEMIEALSPNRTNDSFAVGVRGGASERCSKCSHAHESGGPIQISVEHRTAVVDQELVLLLPREGVAELLNGPLGARMIRHIAVQDSPRTDFHDDVHVQYTKSSGDDIEEVAGDNILGVVADECVPTHRTGLAGLRLQVEDICESSVARLGCQVSEAAHRPCAVRPTSGLRHSSRGSELGDRVELAVGLASAISIATAFETLPGASV